MNKKQIQFSKGFKCEDNRRCFARSERGRCSILKEKPEGLCKFCKPEMEVTNGKRYKYEERKK